MFGDEYLLLPEIDISSINGGSINENGDIYLKNNEDIKQLKENNNNNNIINQNNDKFENNITEYDNLTLISESLNVDSLPSIPGRNKQEEICKKNLEIKQKKLEIEKRNQEKWRNFLQSIVEKHDRNREARESGRPPEKILKLLKQKTDLNENLIKNNFNNHIVHWNKENDDTINIEGNCIYKLNIKDVYEKDLMINLPKKVSDLRTVKIDCNRSTSIKENDLRKMIEQSDYSVMGNPNDVQNESASIRRIYHKDSGKYSLLVKQGKKVFLLTDNIRGHNVKYMNVMKGMESWGIFANSNTQSNFDKWLRKSEPFDDQGGNGKPVDFQLKCLNEYLQSDKAVSVCHPYDFMASFDDWLSETVDGVQGDLEQRDDERQDSDVSDRSSSDEDVESNRISNPDLNQNEVRDRGPE